MPQRNKLSSSPSRPEPCWQARPGESGERGYAFLILMMVLTILLVTLTQALPSVYTAGQREREEELIFRGNQYARAILLYRRQFNRFPSTVDDLVKKTNGFRFLRQAYMDPMTRSGKWRFIHATAAGVVIDAKTIKLPAGSNAGKDAEKKQVENAGKDAEKKQAENAGESAENPAASTSEEKETKGAFIVGVASRRTHKSVRIWNNHDRYDEWEFLAVESASTGAAGVQSGTPATGAQPGMPTPSTQPPPPTSSPQP